MENEMFTYEKRIELFKEEIDKLNQLTHWDDTIKFINEMTLDYSEKLNIARVDLFDMMEENRNYSYANYYQRANFKKLDENVAIFKDKAELIEKIQIQDGFRCPNCNGISKDPQECDTHIKVEDDECNWKSYGLFGTLGKGFNFIVRDDFLKKPKVHEIFMPITLEQPVIDIDNDEIPF